MSNERQSQELRTLAITVGLYVVIFALKLGAYAVTAVLALLAEALHTLSDVFISAFLLGATVLSRRAADEEHMFGHGRAQNVASLVAATLFISFTSYRLFEEAVPRLTAPAEVAYGNLSVALGVILVSMVISAVPLVQFLRQRQRGASATAQMWELFNDELGLLAALGATLGIIFGFPLADPIGTIAVATIIAINALRLLRDNASFLLGRSPGPEFIARITAEARSVDGVLDVDRVRAEYVGPEVVLAGLRIYVRRGTPIEEADAIADEVERRVQAAGGCQYCSIHIEPFPHLPTPASDAGTASRPGGRQ